MILVGEGEGELSGEAADVDEQRGGKGDAMDVDEFALLAHC